MSKVNNNIGEKIIVLLEEKGLTQRELAKRIGVTEISMSRYIGGTREPKGSMLGRIASELNVTVEYLLEQEHETVDVQTEYLRCKKTIESYAKEWTTKQKLTLINKLFGEGEEE